MLVFTTNHKAATNRAASAKEVTSKAGFENNLVINFTVSIFTRVVL